MPKISRRKQSKPQHICGEDSNDGTEVNNGPAGKDTVEDNNANIVGTEDQVNESNDSENQADLDIIPLQLEAEDDDDDCNLKLDESDDRTNFDSDSNYSYDQNVDSETSDKAHLHTPTQSGNDRMCDFCGAVKKSPSDLARHLLKHTGEHPFQCEHCEKAFKSKRSLQHHQHSVHGISLAVSMVAIDASIPLNRKRKSDESVASNSSPECEIKKVKSEPDLYGYPSMVYTGDTQGQMTYLPESSGSFMGSFKYNPLPTKLSPEESNNRTCQVCGKVCSKPSDLKRHMMSHTGERPFRCNICGKAFRAKNSMFYHQKSSHGLNIELSPGLQERFMKLKKQSRLNLVNHQPQGNEEARDGNDPQMSSSLLLQKLGQKVRCANNSVLYSYDINSHQEGEVELDENTGLFKQSGSIFNKPLVTADRIKPEPLKLKNSMVGMQIVQESHNIKRHICVKNETVLVTRLDGVDVLTAKDISLYKCYLCGRLFDDLLKIQCHLSMHFQKELTLYRCQLCDDTFWFKFRVINHIRKNHAKEARRVLKKLEEEEKSKSKDVENLGDSNEMTMETENQLEDDGKTKTDKSKNDEKENETKEDQEPVKEEPDTAEDEKFDLEPSKIGEEDVKSEDEKFDHEPNEKGEESTSTEADKNPENNKSDSKTTSIDDATKDTSEPVAALSDLTHRRKKSDPFVNLYKGIRFRKKPNGSFICLLCRKSFYKEFALLQHIKIHSQQDICYCEECGEGFMEYGKLRLHITNSHKTVNSKGQPSSATAKNTLLSSLLSKTTQWHKPAVILPNPSGSHLEKAREILQKEGIQEDVTVVLPSEPDDQKTTESRKANLDSILSHQESEKFVENDTEESEIHLSPKRLLMSKLLSKSKRKSSQPIKLENPDSLEEMNIEKMRSDGERETTEVKPETVKQEPAEEVQEPKAPPPSTSSDQSVPTSIPVLNSELMAAKLNNLAMMHPGIHPVVMANTLATLAAQGMPINTQGMFLPGSKFFPGITPAYPLIGIPASLNSVSFTGSIPQQPGTNDTPTNQPVSVEIPKPPDNTEESVTVKQEPPSPVDNSNSNHSSITSNDPSPNVSGSESGEKDVLVGNPRVQWNGSDTSESEHIEGNPSNLPSSLQQGWGYSADGRKVTSLSRTHSRLPIVSTPVDREKICKPTVLADGRTVFRCPFCSKDFLSYSDINRHMDFHEDIRPFKCRYCEYYARTNSQLKVHMMRHQGIREFCCRLCNYKGVTQSDLNRHMKSQIHLLKSKHSCHHCDEGFVTPRNLERHLDGNCIVKMQKLENGEVV